MRAFPFRGLGDRRGNEGHPLPKSGSFTASGLIEDEADQNNTRRRSLEGQRAQHTPETRIFALAHRHDHDERGNERDKCQKTWRPRR